MPVAEAGSGPVGAAAAPRRARRRGRDRQPRDGARDGRAGAPAMGGWTRDSEEGGHGAPLGRTGGRWRCHERCTRIWPPARPSRREVGGRAGGRPPGEVSTVCPLRPARKSAAGPDGADQMRSMMVPVPRPPPQHMVTSAVLAVGALELVQGLGEEDGAGAAERVTEGDGAAVGVDRVHVGARARVAHASTTEAKASLISMTSMSSMVMPVRSSRSLGGVDRAGEHEHGVDADEAGVDDLGPGREAERLGLLRGHEQHGAGAVGDLRRGAGGVHAVLAGDGLERGRASRAWSRAGPRRG